MKTKLLTVAIIALAFYLLLVPLNTRADNQTSSQNISIQANINGGIALAITGSPFSFGSLTAGIPSRGSGGVDLGVTTSSASGYILTASDSAAGNGSAMLNDDGNTRIPDFSSDFTTPSFWQTSTSKGLGMTVYSADTNKDAIWGTGTTYNDVNNKFAGISQLDTQFHSSPDYKAATDHTHVGFVVDVTPGQKTGNYSGNVVITATAAI